MSYIQKQHHLGLAGLALLRSWLVKKNSDTKSILSSMYDILSILANSNFEDDTPDVKEFGISEGYRKWADTYDSPNLLMEVEEPEVKTILRKLPKGKVLDVGCGTGRYSIFLRSIGYEVTGLDQSVEMLEKAKQKDKNVTFIQGKIDHLPFVNNNFDLVICSLLLTHFKDLDNPIAELSRVVRKHGYLLISDINPWFVALGTHADFHDKDGKWGYIRNFIHWHSEYLKTFRKYGLKVVDCKEPVLKSKNLRISDLESEGKINKGTLDLALKDLPLVLIWLLKKV